MIANIKIKVITARPGTICIVFLLLGCALSAGCKNSNRQSKESTSEAIGQVSTPKPVPEISIHEAALNGLQNEVTDLLSSGLDVDTTDPEGRTALMYAAFNGHTEIIRRLLEKGALVNKTDLYGRTALMMASSGPFPETVKLLLDHYADPDIADKEEHFTAIMYASAEGHLEVVRLLLAYKADPTLKDIDGDNALTFAANNDHPYVVELLKSVMN